MVDGELGQSAESPERAILLQSPGRKPWVNRRNTFIGPCKGGTTPRQTLAPKVPLLRSSIRFCIVYPGLHFGLCPHSTLGFAGVSCLRHSHQHRPTNPTANANNDTEQSIRQQTQTTTPNQSDNKREQRHRIIIRTANNRWGIRPIRKEPCKGDTPA